MGRVDRAHRNEGRNDDQVDRGQPAEDPTPDVNQPRGDRRRQTAKASEGARGLLIDRLRRTSLLLPFG
jgi:hypothetical protein